MYKFKCRKFFVCVEASIFVDFKGWTYYRLENLTKIKQQQKNIFKELYFKAEELGI